MGLWGTQENIDSLSKDELLDKITMLPWKMSGKNIPALAFKDLKGSKKRLADQMSDRHLLGMVESASLGGLAYYCYDPEILAALAGNPKRFSPPLNGDQISDLHQLEANVRMVIGPILEIVNRPNRDDPEHIALSLLPDEGTDYNNALMFLAGKGLNVELGTVAIMSGRIRLDNCAVGTLALGHKYLQEKARQRQI